MKPFEILIPPFLSIFSRFLYGDQAKFFEAETKPRIKHKKRGTVSMANNGDNLHGSQVSCEVPNYYLFKHSPQRYLPVLFFINVIAYKNILVNHKNLYFL